MAFVHYGGFCNQRKEQSARPSFHPQAIHRRPLEGRHMCTQRTQREEERDTETLVLDAVVDGGEGGGQWQKRQNKFFGA